VKTSVWIIVFCILAFGAGSASAKTPDGKPPSRETVCDNEKGAAFGLCNAYCEAMDCDDPRVRASNKACQAVKRNFEKKTGRPLPCEVSCPCPGLLQLFADIDSGAATVTDCITDDLLLYVVTDTTDYALIFDGPPGNCSVNAEAPFVELTGTELLACRVALRRAAEAQGVACRPVE
jgi:hypothetical protein